MTIHHYAVTNVTYQLAEDGELPSVLGEPIAHSREGLVISGVLVIGLSVLFDLSEIAAIGSISLLFVHAVTHAGHLNITSETGASRLLVLLAVIFSLAAMALAFIYVSKESNQVIGILIGFIVVAATTGILLQKMAERRVKSRI